MWRSLSFWGIVISSFLSWGAWGIVINEISPSESPEIAFPAFYATLFFSLWSTLSLLGSLLRKAFRPERASFVCIARSVRQGFILSFLFSFGVFFQQIRMLTWIHILILIFIGIMIEMYFFARQEKKT
jgi:hypothetical protein